ncbi:MAG: hypothetical protein ACTSVI_16080 [Promethearchaeota archaeon]
MTLHLFFFLFSIKTNGGSRKKKFTRFSTLHPNPGCLKEKSKTRLKFSASTFMDLGHSRCPHYNGSRV